MSLIGNSVIKQYPNSLTLQIPQIYHIINFSVLNLVNYLRERLSVDSQTI